MVFVFLSNMQESCISLYYREEKNGPYTLELMQGPYTRKVGNTSQQDYEKYF